MKEEGREELLTMKGGNCKNQGEVNDEMREEGTEKGRERKRGRAGRGD